MRSPVHIRAGDLWGSPFMKFTLTYDGRLPPSANKPKSKEKWEIRKQLHPQLVDLWSNHPSLRRAEEAREFPLNGAMLMQRHHLHPGALRFPRTLPDPEYVDEGKIDLCANIDRHGVLFRPLVRENHALHCGLSVLFLRKEDPGRVYQGGDIDGRIKTLLDALAMPQHVEQIVADKDAPSPVYCLLEDDALVSSLDVKTERLLQGDNQPRDYVRLIIEVDVKVRYATIYNQSFVG